MLKQKINNYLDAPLTWRRYYKTGLVSFGIGMVLGALTFGGLTIKQKVDEWQYRKQIVRASMEDRKRLEQEEEP